METATAGHEILRFGVFELNLHTGELRKAGHKIALRPQAARVLVLLTTRPGQLVAREKLRDEIWGAEVFIDFERGLNQCIRQIRAALDDDAETPRYIETLPRLGYRFIGPILDGGDALTRGNELAAAPRPRLWIPGSKAVAAAAVVLASLVAATTYLHIGRKSVEVTPPITSIAVLPLENLSGDPNQDFFAEGMTEELITTLSKISALKVISRTSVMQYKGVKRPVPQIARELGVDAIIEGSVLRSRDQVRITAQLINASSDTHVWGESYDRDVRDVLTLQSEVARAIAQEIRVAITPAEQRRLAAVHPVNPEAHELYLIGRYHWWKRTAPDMAKAIEAFKQAIKAEPNYAAAYAGLADAQSISADNGFQPPEMGKAEARAAALKAVALDDSLAEAHIALGNIYDTYDWDWARADAEFRRAIALDPNSAVAYLAYAAYLSTVRRDEEAIAAGLHARELDPLATRIDAVLAAIYYCAHRYDEAIATSQKGLEIDPNDAMGHYILGKSYLQKHMNAQAVAELERLLASGDNGGSALVGAYVAADRAADAHRLFARFMAESHRRYIPPYNLAEAHVGVAGEDQIFAWLEKSYEAHDASLPWSSADPLWDHLRSNPRFMELLRRMNLNP